MNFFGLWPGEWLEDDEEAASPPPQPREHVSPRSPSRQRDSPRRQELSAPEWDDDFGMAFPAQEKPSKHYVHSVRKKTRTRHSPDDIEQQNSSESADTLRPVREDSMEVNCTTFFMDGECAHYYVDEEDLEVLSIQVQVPKSLLSSRHVVRMSRRVCRACLQRTPRLTFRSPLQHKRKHQKALIHWKMTRSHWIA